MQYILPGLLFILAITILPAIVSVWGLWRKGITSLAIRNLGILISTKLLLALLIAVAVIAVILAIYCYVLLNAF